MATLGPKGELPVNVEAQIGNSARMSPRPLAGNHPAGDRIAPGVGALFQRRQSRESGNPPSVNTEGEALLAYLVQQREGLKNAAYGLTDEQARTRPRWSTRGATIGRYNACDEGMT
jgi:hypothetical protein